MNTKAVKKPSFDKTQREKLKEHAEGIMLGFLQGVIRKGDPQPFNFGDSGGTFFDGYTARFTPKFLEARREFVILAAKMLKARAAHEPTLANLCLTAAQDCIKRLKQVGSHTNPDLVVEQSVEKLVDKALAEGGAQYTQIVPNFLVIPNGYDGPVKVGRVTSMRTVDASTMAGLSGNKKVSLKSGDYPNINNSSPGTVSIGMPSMVFVVEVPAARPNVAEEAKWLIDVAISFMRLMGEPWSARYPQIGEIEPHPTRQTLTQPHVTIAGGEVFGGGFPTHGAYDVDEATADSLARESIQKLADLLFDAAEKTLAGRVAQGLGWITRGRQVSDRAERLLAFFTALEALLTSDDKTAPITQNISRFVSVICTSDLEQRMEIFSQLKSIYSVRSAVVHGGKREVLWQDVNALQTYTEFVFKIVLTRCDMTIGYAKFGESLAWASHGLRWEFASPEVDRAAEAEENLRDIGDVTSL
ncbi:HEPN domain-containing protein [Mesorhizobium sp. M0518]|uniref:hypothetical protein n=1 Tax=Mesorhizobium sp. M0518 TaxID=2956956 RepID=UPI00333BD277